MESFMTEMRGQFSSLTSKAVVVEKQVSINQTALQTRLIEGKAALIGSDPNQHRGEDSPIHLRQRHVNGHPHPDQDHVVHEDGRDD
ncbi:hypothetical protein Dimus_017805, partial [Dionaea muscipula]